MVAVNLKTILKLKNTPQVRQTISNTIRKVIFKSQKELKTSYALAIKKRLLSAEVQNFFISKILDVLQTMQGEYFNSGLAAKEDPTLFMNYADEVANEIRNNLAMAASNVSETGQLDLVVLSDDFIGIGKEQDVKGTAPIQWLVYFLIGNLDDNLLWINKEVYGILTGQEGQNLGRFGEGFLWQVSPEGMKIIDAKLKKAGYNYSVSDLKHPQSGKPGRNWFANIISEDDIQSLILNPAAQEASKTVQDKILREYR